MYARRRPLLRGRGRRRGAAGSCTAPAPAAAAPSSPMLDQLNQLAALHQQGILSDEAFTAAKAKLLAT